MRRSLAIGGTLTRADAEQLLDACATLLAERAAIARILDDLGPSWTERGGHSTSWRGGRQRGQGVNPTEAGEPVSQRAHDVPPRGASSLG